MSNMAHPLLALPGSGARDLGAACWGPLHDSRVYTSVGGRSS
ncbi:MAG: hypothetical protein ACFB6R_06490 [Alphaproteobacteria bacterium]